MEDIKCIIAANISELRKANKLTQLELAEKLNYSDKAISKWERGDAVPDVAVLKAIADLFGVTLDYLVTTDHDVEQAVPKLSARKLWNRSLITGISIFLVWFVATLSFVTPDIVISNLVTSQNVKVHWLSFVWAVPISMIVWLVFNSVWFKRSRNFLIISLLVWSGLGAIFITLLPFGYSLWQLFLLGIPSQIIIIMWSKLRFKRKRHAEKK